MPQKLYDKAKGELFAYKYIQGQSIIDIANEMGLYRATLYNWLKKEEVQAMITQYRNDISTQAKASIIVDANKYVSNMKALANQMDDKRTALASNIWLLENIMGKNTAKLDINAIQTKVDSLDDNTIDSILNNLDVVDVQVIDSDSDNDQE